MAVIGTAAFSRCSGLTEVIIPNSVKEIGERAFGGLAIKSLTIGSGTEKIGGGAFSECSKLRLINSLNNTPPSTDDYAFYGVDGQTGFCTLRVPEQSIEAYKTAASWKEFSNIVSLETEVVIDRLGDELKDDNGLIYVITSDIESEKTCKITGWYKHTTKDLVIPESVEGYTVTSIGDGALSNTSYKSIKIPETVTEIGAGAFANSYSLESVDLPNGITVINSTTFRGATSLVSIEIPNSVTSIGEGAFLDCYSLTSVKLPESLTAIGDAAFLFCMALPSIVIPTAVKSIENNAFAYSNNLKEVIFYPKELESYGSFGVFAAVHRDCKVYVPGSSLETYKNHWAQYEVEILPLTDAMTYVKSIESGVTANGKTYNLQGMEVSDGYKGIIIKNGKKFLIK